MLFVGAFITGTVGDRHYGWRSLGRTNTTVNDPELWKWAKMRAVELELRGVSEYLFLLVEKDRSDGLVDLDDTPGGGP